MPAELLEKPTTPQVAPREVSRVRPAVSATSERTAVSLSQRIGALLVEVFEGPEEFLGWTPD